MSRISAPIRLFILCIVMAVGMGRVIAQDSPHVYILVVDDFGNHMRALTESVLETQAFRNSLAPLIEEADRISERIDIQRLEGISLENLSNFSERQQQIPDVLGEFPIERINAQIARNAPSFNRLFERNRLIAGSITEENCAVIPEGQGFFSTGGASFFSTGGAGWFSTGGAGFSNAPHGERVMAQLEELKAEFAPDAPITMVAVDTEGFTTSVIMQNIASAINEIAEKDPGAHIVINMSFAVIPCENVGSLAAYDAAMSQFDPQTEEDLAALQAFFAAVLVSGTYQAPLHGDDALISFITDICPQAAQAALRTARATANPCQSRGVGSIIAVAAAGNSGEPFPYAPAQWAGIVSVSASEDSADFVTTEPRASYSNEGGVMLPGTWESTVHNTTDVGTSFAAPRYSFMMALLLAGIDNDFCATGAQVQPSLPDVWTPQSTPPNPNDTIC